MELMNKTENQAAEKVAAVAAPKTAAAPKTKSVRKAKAAPKTASKTAASRKPKTVRATRSATKAKTAPKAASRKPKTVSKTKVAAVMNDTLEPVAAVAPAAVDTPPAVQAAVEASSDVKAATVLDAVPVVKDEAVAETAPAVEAEPDVDYDDDFYPFDEYSILDTIERRYGVNVRAAYYAVEDVLMASITLVTKALDKHRPLVHKVSRTGSSYVAFPTIGKVIGRGDSIVRGNDRLVQCVWDSVVKSELDDLVDNAWRDIVGDARAIAEQEGLAADAVKSASKWFTDIADDISKSGGLDHDKLWIFEDAMTRLQSAREEMDAVSEINKAVAVYVDIAGAVAGNWLRPDEMDESASAESGV